MKKLLTNLIVLLLVVLLLPGTASAAEYVEFGSCGRSVTWKLDSEGTLTISGRGRMEDYDWNHNSPFRENANIVSIIIEDGITSIGDYAFVNCTGLTNISTPDSISSIGSHAFNGCTGLTSITIPDGVSSIHPYTFYGCAGLTSVTIPDAVRSIDVYAFDGCTSLTEITLPNRLSRISTGTFGNCTGLTSITIPDSVTSLGEHAFAGCTGLTSITIPEKVTRVERFAFRGCTGLASITIPDSVTQIEACAFSGCTGLTSLTIPDSVTSIGDDAFKNCASLTSIKLSDSIEKIGFNLFSGCASLTSITIPESVTYLGNSAFKDCTSLTGILIPTSVTNIGSGAFEGCTGLTSITIPDSVTYLGDIIFKGCTRLTSIRFEGNAPKFGVGYYDGNWCAMQFHDVTAIAYYPAGNETWTEEVTQSYGGSITWVAEELTSLEPLRVAGTHRFETAFFAAHQLKVTLGIEKFDTVVVASGMDFADALSGSYLAAVKNAPILLACQVESINDTVKDYIKENLKEGGKIYILGGENAVPASFETGLDGFNVERLAGANRFETNLLVLETAGVGDKPILVSTGGNFADSLSASAANLPILLVYGDKLLDSQTTFLEANRDKNLCILGGTGAVSEKLEVQLAGYGTVERLAGKTRFDTSVMIAEKFFDNPRSAVLAYAWNFPDGLCGGPLAAALNAPLILTMEKYETQAADYIQGNSIQTGVILGGEKLIPNSSVNTIFNVQ